MEYRDQVMRQARRLRQFDCPVFGFQQTINGKYKIRILWDLQKGPGRYGEIRHGLLTGNIGSKEISPRVLSRELKELMTLGLIERQDFEVKPPKVEYSLSGEGQSLIPAFDDQAEARVVISVMYDWGVQHLVKGSTS